MSSAEELAEDQEMEVEALTSIFEEDFKIVSAEPHEFTVRCVPHQGDEPEEPNHVEVLFTFKLGPMYPEELPEFTIKVVKGLSNSQLEEIKSLASETAEEAVGEVMVFTIVDAVKEWLLDHNVEELDAHTAMMRREQEEREANEALAAEKAKKAEKQAEEEAMISPLGIHPGEPTTVASFARWLGMFKEEQRKLAGPAAEKSELTGKQLFKQNLAKVLQDGEDPPKQGEEVFCFDKSLYDDEDLPDDDSE